MENKILEYFPSSRVQNSEHGRLWPCIASNSLRGTWEAEAGIAQATHSSEFDASLDYTARLSPVNMSRQEGNLSLSFQKLHRNSYHMERSHGSYLRCFTCLRPNLEFVHSTNLY